MRYENYTNVSGPLELMIDQLLDGTSDQKRNSADLLKFIKNLNHPICVKKSDSSGVYFHNMILARLYVWSY